jgi:peptidoglycan/xylan/chitin deacetylase (PgdA/CDA1 family)
MRELTVVMYHYVRELQRSRYPAIKGLTVEEFRGQLGFFARDHHFVGVADVVAAHRGEQDLPPKAVLLTFDDGYADHYRYVLPILDALGIEGSFFPSAAVIHDRRVLDVNKIHFTLAAVGDPAPLAAFVLDRVAALRDDYGLRAPDAYQAELAHATHLDDATTILIKRLLQRALPVPARRRIADEAFRRFVTEDEAAFAEELYLTEDQARVMHRAGMRFGNHGTDHLWFDHTDEDTQRREMAGGIELLRSIGEDGDFLIAYPYGGHTARTVEIARELGHRVGFTVVRETARVGEVDPLRIPRFDTVDFPFTPAG